MVLVGGMVILVVGSGHIADFEERMRGERWRDSETGLNIYICLGTKCGLRGPMPRAWSRKQGVVAIHVRVEALPSWRGKVQSNLDMIQALSLIRIKSCVRPLV